MEKFNNVLIVTHIIYRKTSPFDALEGPYSSVANALAKRQKVDALQIPIDGYSGGLKYGPWKYEKTITIPRFLGKLAPVKYLLDMFIAIWLVTKYRFQNRGPMLLIAIDPLSCFPLVFLRKILDFYLVFYSVDFNKNRFGNKLMQYLYEKADEISTRGSDQTWVVCESLQDYKKEQFGVLSKYIPNSSPFDPSLYAKGKDRRKGNRVAWTGSLLTDRQFDILFGLFKKLEELRPDLSFVVAPTGKYEKFAEYGKKYGLKSFEVLHLTSRRAWQEVAAACDIGVAVYDDKFGSTYFIEPLKIWDFLMCGMPFIISCEPSLSTPIKESGVAYLLGKANTVADKNSLKKFIEKENIMSLQEKCVELAEKFDIGTQIAKSLR